MVRGGIVYEDGCVALTIKPTGGGNGYTRVFDDVVETAIERFVLFETLLGQALSQPIAAKDTTFYVNQLRYLLKRAHVQQLPGEMLFQQRYNMRLLDGYVRMLMPNGSLNLALVAQLLGLDEVLHYVEDADEIHASIPFRVPRHLVARLADGSTLAKPRGDTIQDYIISLNSNLKLLTGTLQHRKAVFEEIHSVILDAAKQRFQ